MKALQQYDITVYVSAIGRFLLHRRSNAEIWCFSLLLAWTNCEINDWDASDLRRFDFNVISPKCECTFWCPSSATTTYWAMHLVHSLRKIRGQMFMLMLTKLLGNLLSWLSCCIDLFGKIYVGTVVSRRSLRCEVGNTSAHQVGGFERFFALS